MSWIDKDDPVVEYDNFIDIIVEKVPILQVLDKFGIEYSECKSGNFTHRAKCPLPLHSNGCERTASFYISDINNSFCCFGCNSNSNSIGFVELYTGKPYNVAARWLAEQFGVCGDGNEDITIKRRSPEEIPITHIHKSGVVIRDFLTTMKDTEDYNKWCKWADKRFDTLDKYIDTLKDDEWETAKKYYDKVVSFLNKGGSK